MESNASSGAQGKSTVTRLFSKPLFAQDVRSNIILTIAILAIMCLMCCVFSVATNMLATEKIDQKVQDAQEELFVYLGGMAAYNQSMGQMTGVELSCDDFLQADSHDAYQEAFEFLNQNAGLDEELSVEGFEGVLSVMQTSPVPLESYVREFEYAFALAQDKGVFSGEELQVEDMMATTLEIAGVSSDLVDNMSEMDTGSMLNTMYFKVIGLLPIFLLIVLLGNSLIAGKVDKGSMGFILSTPTKRSAVAFTQALFMLVVPAVLIAIVCALKIAVMTRLGSDVNVQALVTTYAGWYLLVEAVAALCYFGGCFFDTSGRALAFGGGLTVWFFIASFLGVFGSDNLVNMGVGVEQLGVFNKLTLTGLLDIDAINTVGTSSVDISFLVGYAALAIIAVVFYVAGAVKFTRKDLPL